MCIVQVNSIDTKSLERLVDLLVDPLRIATDPSRGEAKFGRKEDIISLSCALEPCK
jgi:hypothetical protein